MKKTTTRNRLPKAINKIAQSDDAESRSHAIEIAECGKPFTAIEKQLDEYYGFRAKLDRSSKHHWGDKPSKFMTTEPDGSQRRLTYHEVAGICANKISDSLCEQYMEAINNNDFAKIHEFADAVRFLKTRKFPFSPAAEPERAALLHLKHGLIDSHQRMTVREVAEHLAWENAFKANPSLTCQKPKLKTPDDGFSALRRLCKEINFPLAPSRKISRK